MNILKFDMSSLVEVENVESFVCMCLLHAGHCRLKNMLYEGMAVYFSFPGRRGGGGKNMDF